MHSEEHVFPAPHVPSVVLLIISPYYILYYYNIIAYGIKVALSILISLSMTCDRSVNSLINENDRHEITNILSTESIVFLKDFSIDACNIFDILYNHTPKIALICIS